PLDAGHGRTPADPLDLPPDPAGAGPDRRDPSRADRLLAFSKGPRPSGLASRLGRDAAHAAGLVVEERLANLALGVHDERPVAGDGLAQWLACEQQGLQRPGPGRLELDGLAAGFEDGELRLVDRTGAH